VSGEVHVWRAALDRPPRAIEAFHRTLASDERRRAVRLLHALHRRRFIVARGCLRAILSRYLDLTPERVLFDYGAHGKPAIDPAQMPGAPLHFNLTHCGDLALVAVTRVGHTGIDLEELQADFPVQQVARRFFAPGEVARLGQLAPQQRGTAFFRCWTRKEAFVKANGLGLSLPLDRFEVSLEPGAPAALLHTDWDVGEAARLTLHALPAGPRHVAALAVRGHDFRLRHVQL
jgi:4'-phosphopantetheinyl transferase